ncbi:type I secretion outer membrane protein tolC precursor [alpha proteobacterium U9-1i]|nr:type I secretion outer membrane protein tolC precursor [alpha proteobacterium U9-1i]
MRALMVSLLALSIAMPASADTLAEAMSAAVDSNPTLAAQRARLRATREQLPQAWAEALPQISISGGATRSSSSGERSDGTPITDPASESWSSSASASQLLFGSGRVLASTRAARASIRGAVADYDLALQNLLIDVTSAYANVRQSQDVVAAREQTVSNLGTLLEYAQAQFDAGVVTRTDVAQAQARYAQARTQLVQAQGGLAAAVQAYQRLVGRPPSDLQAPPQTQGLPADLESALNTAGTNSPVLRGAIADTELADANVDVAAAQGRLRVTLEGSQSLSGDFDAEDFQAEGDSVGVRLSVPLFQGGAIRSRTRAQRALRSASNLDLAAAQRNVQEGVTNAWTGLASARAAVESARDQVQASELAYEGVRLEQETGLRSTVEVLDQEQDLLTARLALAQAERDLVVAERQMLAQIGQLAPPLDAADAGEIRGR